MLKWRTLGATLHGRVVSLLKHLGPRGSGSELGWLWVVIGGIGFDNNTHQERLKVKQGGFLVEEVWTGGKASRRRYWKDWSLEVVYVWFYCVWFRREGMYLSIREALCMRTWDVVAPKYISPKNEFIESCKWVKWTLLLMNDEFSWTFIAKVWHRMPTVRSKG